jgi:hypothetical protein
VVRRLDIYISSKLEELSWKDVHELFVFDLVLVVRVLETFLGLLNNFEHNFLYGLGEALNKQVILLELIVDLVVNSVEIIMDIAAKTASIVPQVNVLALLSLGGWVSHHR